MFVLKQETKKGKIKDMFKNLSEKPIAEVQNEQVAKWKEEDLLTKCVTAREGATPFVFYEGPPTANGIPALSCNGIQSPLMFLP